MSNIRYPNPKISISKLSARRGGAGRGIQYRSQHIVYKIAYVAENSFAFFQLNRSDIIERKRESTVFLDAQKRTDAKTSGFPG